jgi:tetratricopeptide (TPR) repeat protein
VTFVESQLAKTPENPLALLLRGALHQLAGEADQAEARYRAVIAARSDSPGGYAMLARFYLAENRDAEAEQTLRDGLAAVPNNPGLLLRLASLLEAQGDFDAAIEFYGRLYEVRPDSGVAANNFASLVADHRADDPESLERAFSAAKRLRASEVPQYQDTYGWLQYLRGDFDGALRSLIPVAEALPDNPWVRYHIGMTYSKLGKGAEARLHLEAALELAGEGPFTKVDEIRAALATLPAE